MPAYLISWDQKQQVWGTSLVVYWLTLWTSVQGAQSLVRELDPISQVAHPFLPLPKKKKAAAGSGRTLTHSSLPAPQFPTVAFPTITWWFLTHSEL